MTTMSARLPPDASTKRCRMRGSFSLFSAPPIGTIQPRVSPSGTLLGTSHAPRLRILRRIIRGPRRAVLGVIDLRFGICERARAGDEGVVALNRHQADQDQQSERRHENRELER